MELFFCDTLRGRREMGKWRSEGKARLGYRIAYDIKLVKQ